MEHVKEREGCDGLVSQDVALFLGALGALFLLEHGGAGGVLEDFSDAFVGLRRALEVFVGSDLFAYVFSLI